MCMPLKAVAFNCTLKPSTEASSTELLITQILNAMKHYKIEGQIERIVDYDIKPGKGDREAAWTMWGSFKHMMS